MMEGEKGTKLDYACSFYVARVPETIFSTDDSVSLKVRLCLVSFSLENA